MSPCLGFTGSSTFSTGKFGHVSILLVVLTIIFLPRIYRYQVEDYLCWTQVLSGSLQTALYFDFLYYYFLSVKEGKPVRYELPV